MLSLQYQFFYSSRILLRTANHLRLLDLSYIPPPQKKSSYFTLKYIKYFPHSFPEPLTRLLPSIPLSQIHAVVMMLRPKDFFYKSTGPWFSGLLAVIQRFIDITLVLLIIGLFTQGFFSVGITVNRNHRQLVMKQRSIRSD